jgi:hypothetical protein
MTLLTRHDCLHHPLREAVARCAVCRGFYCRECVSEHEGRMICAPCLAAPAALTETQGVPRLRNAGAWFLALLCLTFWWILFYCLGRLLSSMPSSFHDNILQ